MNFNGGKNRNLLQTNDLAFVRDFRRIVYIHSLGSHAFWNAVNKRNYGYNKYINIRSVFWKYHIVFNILE